MPISNRELQLQNENLRLQLQLQSGKSKGNHGNQGQPKGQPKFPSSSVSVFGQGDKRISEIKKTIREDAAGETGISFNSIAVSEKGAEHALTNMAQKYMYTDDQIKTMIRDGTDANLLKAKIDHRIELASKTMGRVKDKADALPHIMRQKMYSSAGFVETSQIPQVN